MTKQGLFQWAALVLLLLLAVPVTTAWVPLDYIRVGFAVLAVGWLAIAYFKQQKALRRYQNTRVQRDDRALVDASQTGVARLSPAARQRRMQLRKQQLEERLQTIASTLRRIIGAHAAVCYLRDAGDNLVLACADLIDDNEFETRIKPGGSDMLSWVFRHSQPFVAMELRRVSGLSHYKSDPDIRSFLAVPVLRDESCVGVLAVDSREVQAFSEEEYRHILDVMANQIAQWLKIDDDQAQAGEELEHWRAFFSAAQDLQAVNRLSEAVSRALELVDTVVRADMIALCEAVPNQRSYVVRGIRGDVADIEPNHAISADESWAGWALEQTTERHVDDFSRRKLNMPVFCDGDGIPKQGSCLCIPFDVNHETETTGGGLVLWSHRINEFRTNEVDLLSRLIAPFSLAFSRLRATEALRRMATKDALTGLNNRRVANETLVREIRRAARNDAEVGVVLFDVDHFKRVNDNYGHDIGDAVLKNVAKVLLRTVREIDTAARFGGEEFLAILPQTDAKGAQKSAERIRKALERSRTPLPNGEYLTVTASFGVSMFDPQSQESVNSLLKRADEALYAAKEGGRNCVMISTAPPMEPTLGT